MTWLQYESATILLSYTHVVLTYILHVLLCIVRSLYSSFHVHILPLVYSAFTPKRYKIYPAYFFHLLYPLILLIVRC